MLRLPMSATAFSHAINSVKPVWMSCRWLGAKQKNLHRISGKLRWWNQANPRFRRTAAVDRKWTLSGESYRTWELSWMQNQPVNQACISGMPARSYEMVKTMLHTVLDKSIRYSYAYMFKNKCGRKTAWITDKAQWDFYNQYYETRQYVLFTL